MGINLFKQTNYIIHYITDKRGFVFGGIKKMWPLWATTKDNFFVFDDYKRHIRFAINRKHATEEDYPGVAYKIWPPDDYHIFGPLNCINKLPDHKG